MATKITVSAEDLMAGDKFGEVAVRTVTGVRVVGTQVTIFTKGTQGLVPVGTQFVITRK